MNNNSLNYSKSHIYNNNYHLSKKETIDDFLKDKSKKYIIRTIINLLYKYDISLNEIIQRLSENYINHKV